MIRLLKIYQIDLVRDSYVLWFLILILKICMCSVVQLNIIEWTLFYVSISVVQLFLRESHHLIYSNQLE